MENFCIVIQMGIIGSSEISVGFGSFAKKKGNGKQKSSLRMVTELFANFGHNCGSFVWTIHPHSYH